MSIFFSSRRELKRINAELRDALKRSDSMLREVWKQCEKCEHSVPYQDEDYPFGVYYCCERDCKLKAIAEANLTKLIDSTEL